MTIKSVFNNKRFWHSCMSLAVPIAFQNLLSASFSMVDTFMVASLGGTVLSAVGMASQYNMIMNAIIFGLSSGVALFVSQYKGAHNTRGIHRTEGISILFTTVIALLFSIISFIFAPSIISIFSRTQSIIEIGSTYIRYVSFFYVPMSLMFVLNIVLRATANVKLPVIMSAVTSVLNVLLNYCLIFGKVGLPKMGASGAALATSISNWIALIILIIITVLTKNILYAPFKELFSFKWHHIKEFLSKAVPSLLNELAWMFGIFLLSVIFANMGDDYYAGVTIQKTLENLAFVFSVGLCNACSIMVGMSMGAGQIKEAKEHAIRFNVIMPIFSAIVAIIVFLLRNPLVQLFTLNGEYTETAISSGILCISVYAFVLTFRNIPYLMIVGIFRPSGDAKGGMLFDLLPLWIVSIPITAILAFIVKVPFQYLFLITYMLEDIPKITSCFIYFISEKWMKPVTGEGIKGLKEYKKDKETKKSV